MISDLGYGRGFFTGALSPEYLASKFLEKDWHLAPAQAWLRQERAEANAARAHLDPQHPRAVGLAARIEAIEHLLYIEHELTAWHLCDAFPEDCDEATPGWGYDPVAAGWLEAVQKTFAAKYAARPRGQAA